MSGKRFVCMHLALMVVIMFAFFQAQAPAASLVWDAIGNPTGTWDSNPANLPWNGAAFATGRRRDLQR